LAIPDVGGKVEDAVPRSARAAQATGQGDRAVDTETQQGQRKIERAAHVVAFGVNLDEVEALPVPPLASVPDLVIVDESDHGKILPFVDESTAYVFDRGDGARFEPGVVRRRFDIAQKAAGVPRLVVHGLRHTGATLDALEGMPMQLLSDKLGHESKAFTLSVYNHGTVADQARWSEAAVAGVVGTRAG
jgi:hypothetical protein